MGKCVGKQSDKNSIWVYTSHLTTSNINSGHNPAVKMRVNLINVRFVGRDRVRETDLGLF